MTEREFTAAAERHLDTVYRVALNCLRNPADAEDAAQTVHAAAVAVRAGVPR